MRIKQFKVEDIYPVLWQPGGLEDSRGYETQQLYSSAVLLPFPVGFDIMMKKRLPFILQNVLSGAGVKFFNTCSLCPIHVLAFTLISTDYIQKR